MVRYGGEWHMINGQKYHVSKNLFDKSNGSYNAYVDDEGTWRYVDTAKSVKILCSANTTYTLSVPENLSVFRIYEISDALAEPPTQAAEIVRSGGIDRYTFTTASTTAAIIFQGSAGNFDEWFNGLMLNTGSTASPYEPYGDIWTDVPIPTRKYVNGAWVDISPKQYINGQWV